MLTTVVIILREFLEASILISLLAVLHLKLHFYRHWLSVSLVAGIITAWYYASAFAHISDWFDGSGQEVLNGISLLCIGFSLAFQLVVYAWHHRKPTDSSSTKSSLLTLALSITAMVIMVMAVAREGAEIIIYYSGMAETQRHSSSMLIGGIIGSGLGLCIGILSFTLLYQLAARNLMLVSSALLILITAGVMTEATQSFIQAGWVITAEPLWDTSSFIAESSVTGQLLYAVFAYEASPTLEEIMAWCATTLLLSGALLAMRNKKILSAGA
jgi:high-affinity iron transporter